MSIWSELTKAESQESPHYWASVLAAHCWVGMGLWTIAALVLGQWQAVIAVTVLYFFIWEASQLYIARKSLSYRLVADSVLDTVAVGLGCLTAAHLSDGALIPAILAWAASFLIAAVGWRVRQ